VRRCPNPDGGDSDIEIRQISEVADFAEVITPEHREAIEQFRAKGGQAEKR